MVRMTVRNPFSSSIGDHLAKGYLGSFRAVCLAQLGQKAVPGGMKVRQGAVHVTLPWHASPGQQHGRTVLRKCEGYLGSFRVVCLAQLGQKAVHGGMRVRSSFSANANASSLGRSMHACVLADSPTMITPAEHAMLCWGGA